MQHKNGVSSFLLAQYRQSAGGHQHKHARSDRNGQAATALIVGCRIGAGDGFRSGRRLGIGDGFALRGGSFTLGQGVCFGGGGLGFLGGLAGGFGFDGGLVVVVADIVGLLVGLIGAEPGMGDQLAGFAVDAEARLGVLIVANVLVADADLQTVLGEQVEECGGLQ